MKYIFSKKGVATIPIILALTILVIAIGLAISTVAFNEAFIAQDFSRSSQALVYAEAGARDALIKITRNGKYNTVISGPYTIDFVENGCTSSYGGCATVEVDSNTNPKLITSEGRVKNNIRKVRVAVTFDVDGYWVITGATWQEVTD